MLRIGMLGIFDSIWISIVNFFVSIFYKLYFAIIKAIAWVLDMLTQLFFIFSGMTPIGTSSSSNDEGVDIVNYFLKQSSFQKGYLYLCLVALGLIIVFTIAKIIKQDYFDRSGPRSKAPIFRSVALSFIAFICVIPIFYFLMQVVGALALLTMRALGYSGGGIGTMLFNLSWDDGGVSIQSYTQTFATRQTDPNNFGWYPAETFYQYFWDADNGEARKVIVGGASSGQPLAEFYWYIFLIAGLNILVGLAKMMLAMISRLYKLIALFIIAPSPISQIVLDDGQKFKRWKDLVLQEAVKVIGCVMCFMVFILVATAVNDIDLMKFAFTDKAASAINLIDSNRLTTELSNGISPLYYYGDTISWVDKAINALGKAMILVAGVGAIQDMDSVITPLLAGGSSSMDMGAAGKQISSTAAAGAKFAMQTGRSALALGGKALGGVAGLALKAGGGIANKIKNKNGGDGEAESADENKDSSAGNSTETPTNGGPNGPDTPETVETPQNTETTAGNTENAETVAGNTETGNTENAETVAGNTETGNTENAETGNTENAETGNTENTNVEAKNDTNEDTSGGTETPENAEIGDMEKPETVPEDAKPGKEEDTNKKEKSDKDEKEEPTSEENNNDEDDKKDSVTLNAQNVTVNGTVNSDEDEGSGSDGSVTPSDTNEGAGGSNDVGGTEIATLNAQNVTVNGTVDSDGSEGSGNDGADSPSDTDGGTSAPSDTNEGAGGSSSDGTGTANDTNGAAGEPASEDGNNGGEDSKDSVTLNAQNVTVNGTVDSDGAGGSGSDGADSPSDTNGGTSTANDTNGSAGGNSDGGTGSPSDTNGGTSTANDTNGSAGGSSDGGTGSPSDTNGGTSSPSGANGSAGGSSSDGTGTANDTNGSAGGSSDGGTSSPSGVNDAADGSSDGGSGIEEKPTAKTAAKDDEKVKKAQETAEKIAEKQKEKGIKTGAKGVRKALKIGAKTLKIASKPLLPILHTAASIGGGLGKLLLTAGGMGNVATSLENFGKETKHMAGQGLKKFYSKHLQPAKDKKGNLIHKSPIHEKINQMLGLAPKDSSSEKQTDKSTNSTEGQTNATTNQTEGQAGAPANTTEGQADATTNQVEGQAGASANSTGGQVGAPANTTEGQAGAPVTSSGTVPNASSGAQVEQAAKAAQEAKSQSKAKVKIQAKVTKEEKEALNAGSKYVDNSVKGLNSVKTSKNNEELDVEAKGKNDSAISAVTTSAGELIQDAEEVANMHKKVTGEKDKNLISDEDRKKEYKNKRKIYEEAKKAFDVSKKDDDKKTKKEACDAARKNLKEAESKCTIMDRFKVAKDEFDALADITKENPTKENNKELIKKGKEVEKLGNQLTKKMQTSYAKTKKAGAKNAKSVQKENKYNGMKENWNKKFTEKMDFIPTGDKKNKLDEQFKSLYNKEKQSIFTNGRMKALYTKTEKIIQNQQKKKEKELMKQATKNYKEAEKNKNARRQKLLELVKQGSKTRAEEENKKRINDIKKEMGFEKYNQKNDVSEGNNVSREETAADEVDDNSNEKTKIVAEVERENRDGEGKQVSESNDQNVNKQVPKQEAKAGKPKAGGKEADVDFEVVEKSKTNGKSPRKSTKKAEIKTPQVNAPTTGLGARVLKSSKARKKGEISKMIIKASVDKQIGDELGEVALRLFGDKKGSKYINSKDGSERDLRDDVMKIPDEAIDKKQEKELKDRLAQAPISSKKDLSDKYTNAKKGYSTAMKAAKDAMDRFKNSNDPIDLGAVKNAIAAAMSHSVDLADIKIQVEKSKK